jgi:hypothetical protein
MSVFVSGRTSTTRRHQCVVAIGAMANEGLQRSALRDLVVLSLCVAQMLDEQREAIEQLSARKTGLRRCCADAPSNSPDDSSHECAAFLRDLDEPKPPGAARLGGLAAQIEIEMIIQEQQARKPEEQLRSCRRGRTDSLISEMPNKSAHVGDAEQIH